MEDPPDGKIVPPAGDMPDDQDVEGVVGFVPVEVGIRGCEDVVLGVDVVVLGREVELVVLVLERLVAEVVERVEGRVDEWLVERLVEVVEWLVVVLDERVEERYVEVVLEFLEDVVVVERCVERVVVVLVLVERVVEVELVLVDVEKQDGGIVAGSMAHEPSSSDADGSQLTS